MLKVIKMQSIALSDWICGIHFCGRLRKLVKMTIKPNAGLGWAFWRLGELLWPSKRRKIWYRYAVQAVRPTCPWSSAGNSMWCTKARLTPFWWPKSRLKPRWYSPSKCEWFLDSYLQVFGTQNIRYNAVCDEQLLVLICEELGQTSHWNGVSSLYI